MFDGRRALEFANNYPYRPDSVKTIIQVKATDDDNTSLDQLNVINYFNYFHEFKEPQIGALQSNLFRMGDW